MSRATAAALLLALVGCGYRPPAELKAIRGDWIVDGARPGTFRVLILDPSLDREFYWYESHEYRDGRLVNGSSGNFKYEPGRLSLKRPTGYEEFGIAAVTENELLLRAEGADTAFRRMTEDDYGRVDWTVSKIERLKTRGGPRETNTKAKRKRTD